MSDIETEKKEAVAAIGPSARPGQASWALAVLSGGQQTSSQHLWQGPPGHGRMLTGLLLSLIIRMNAGPSWEAVYLGMASQGP